MAHNGGLAPSSTLLKCVLGFLMVGTLRAMPRIVNNNGRYAEGSRPQVITPTSVFLPTPSPDLNFKTEAPRRGSTLHAVKFMQQFGYVPQPDDDAEFLFTPQALEKAIMKMQKFGDIPQTGLIDNATLQLMETPRCGLPDVEPEDFNGGQHVRRKRYIVGSEGWRKRRLTYHVANWTPKLYNMENVKKELRRAFDAWSTYSHLQFTESSDTGADIVIYFAQYAHHDGYPFDGPSGILAHAYYPYEFGHYGGDIHFDDSEDWTMHPKDEYSGLDFFTVAVHEIGHSLGLAHSPEGGSIMFPYYKGYNKNFALDYDDVMAMWELYIKRKLDGDDEYFNSTTTTTTTTPATPSGGDEDDSEDEHQSDGKTDGAGGSDHDDDDDGVLNDEPLDVDDDDNDYDDTYNDIDSDDDDDDDHVRYHGDYETVDEHQRRVSSSGGRGDSLPNLPTLPPEGDSVHVDGGHNDEGEKLDEEEAKKRWEEEERKREEEEKRKDREEEEERRRWEEEIRRREAETRRREEEARRRWEEHDEEGYYPYGRGGEGGRTTSTTTTTTPKPPPPVPDLCEGSFDAVAYMRQELFIFKGQYVWRYTSRGNLRASYPTHIRHLFPELPRFLKKVDAVYERYSDNSLVFFLGKYYYVHDGLQLIEDSPKPLSDLGIPNLYTKIDAAFYWPKAKRTYFFSRNSYFRYDDVTKKMDSGYPKDIKKWNGLPGELDAVFTWTDGQSYFMKGHQYWEYDNDRIRPLAGYPQDATKFWTNCPAKS